MPQPMTNTAQLRKNNQNRVYRCIYAAPHGISKQEITLALGLSTPTVTQNLRVLLEAGLVFAAGQASSTGGRKAQLLVANRAHRVALGVSVTKDCLRLVGVDLQVNVLYYEKIPCTISSKSSLLRAISHAVHAFIARHGLSKERILGVGIALPGLLSPAGTQLESAPTLSLSSVALSSLEALLSLPIHCMNDANAGGFAEWWDFADSRSLAYLSVDHGVGGAVLLRGAPYEGENGRSGEFGHICLQPDGPICSCGRHGCLEAYCSLDRLCSAGEDTPFEFFTRLAAGDDAAACVWQAYLQRLAQGISSLHMALDCPIVLGGGLAQHMEAYLPALQALLPAEQAPIRLCRHRSKATCIGAALYFVQDFLKSV